MKTAVGYLATAVFVGLVTFILVLSSENKLLTDQLNSCKSDLIDSNLNSQIKSATIETQNQKISSLSAIRNQMRENGEKAMREAEEKIAGYQAQIANIRRAPIAISCEGVRLKLISGAGVHL